MSLSWCYSGPPGAAHPRRCVPRSKRKMCPFFAFHWSHTSACLYHQIGGGISVARSEGRLRGHRQGTSTFEQSRSQNRADGDDVQVWVEVCRATWLDLGGSLEGDVRQRSGLSSERRNGVILSSAKGWLGCTLLRSQALMNCELKFHRGRQLVMKVSGKA